MNIVHAYRKETEVIYAQHSSNRRERVLVSLDCRHVRVQDVFQTSRTVLFLDSGTNDQTAKKAYAR